MRAITAALCILVIAALPVHASEPRSSAGTTTAYAQLLDRPRTVVFHYDTESQAANLVLRFGRARFNIGITNALQIPEHEPPGRVDLDEHTLLAEALSGIEVDTGIEHTISMVFSFDW